MTVRMHRVLAVVGALTGAAILFGGCATTGGEGSNEVPDELTKAMASYADFVNAGDAEGYLALWDDGGVQLPPGGPPVEKKMLEPMVRNGFPAFRRTMTLDTQETVVAGDWAFGWCLYTNTMVPVAGGDPVYVDGKSLSIWRRQPDGSWKLYRDCFNSNVP